MVPVVLRGADQARFALRDVRNLEDRVQAMIDLVWEGLKDPEMRKLALQITRRCEARDDLCELKAIFDFNQSRIRYTGDIAGLDTFSTWRRALDFGGEDCDGHSIANATAAGHNGFGCVFRLTTSKAGTPFEHVYAVALFSKLEPQAGIAMDTTLPGGKLGDEPRSIAAYRDFPVLNADGAGSRVRGARGW